MIDFNESCRIWPCNSAHILIHNDPDYSHKTFFFRLPFTSLSSAYTVKNVGEDTELCSPLVNASPRALANVCAIFPAQIPCEQAHGIWCNLNFNLQSFKSGASYDDCPWVPLEPFDLVRKPSWTSPCLWIYDNIWYFPPCVRDQCSPSVYQTNMHRIYHVFYRGWVSNIHVRLNFRRLTGTSRESGFVLLLMISGIRALLTWERVSVESWLQDPSSALRGSQLRGISR